MNTNIVPVADIERMAGAVARSGLFGVKTQEQAMALMLIAQAEGMHPAIAARDYHIIQGRPALKADAMLARFQQAGGKVEWREYTDTKVIGVFSHPSGGSVSVEWSIEMANKAGLTAKNQTWKQYPRQMLRARCISEGIRTVFPGVVSGFYTPEEVQDFAPPEKDVTPVKEQPASPGEAAEHIAKAKAAVKPKTPPPIESTATVVADQPFPTEAGDLSVINTDKPSQESIDRVVTAFEKIGVSKDDLEERYGKELDLWTESDIIESREVYKVLKVERQSILDEIAETRKQQPANSGGLI